MAIIALPIGAKDDATAVRELDKQCKAARELKLKPLRDAEIARCKADSRNVLGYSERYRSDCGAAKRSPNGMDQQRMFNDLPECVAADEARRKLRAAE